METLTRLMGACEANTCRGFAHFDPVAVRIGLQAARRRRNGTPRESRMR